MKQKIESLLSNKKFLIILFLLFALLAGTLKLISSEGCLPENGVKYNNYNNYTIFEKSFDHLQDGKDLYVLYPKEHKDLFKYSPTFSVFFGLFNMFPDWIGLNLWNILNAMIFLFSIYYLPKLTNKQKGLILVFCLIELMTSMQNEQSNGLIAGLIIFAFGFLERDKFLWATLCIVFTVFVKIFGVLGFVLFLFYPHKWKLALYSIGWTLLLFLSPLLFVDVDHYMFLFSSWGNMLSHDQSISYGLSVMGWLYAWFGVEVNKLIIVIIGAITFMIPFVRFREFKQQGFRLLALSSVLIWIVIFNHKAESPTFIIAMAGIALWFFTTEKSRLNTILFILAFILVSLSPTDIFPRYIRDMYVFPYALKALPCILIWFKIIYDMMVHKEEPSVLIDEK
jgi:hypothetical protein